MQTAEQRRAFLLVAVCLLLLILTGHVDAQGPDPASARRSKMVEVLEALARDDWPAASAPAMWRELVQAFDAELARDPGSPMAALVRQAATRIDVDVTPVIVRRVEDLHAQIEGTSALELETPIPYRAEVYASLDGGEWFLFGVVHGGGCGTRILPWAAGLGPGIHSLHTIVDISYLRQTAAPAKEGPCTLRPSAGGDSLPPLDPDNVIHRERRELSAHSFGIFPVLPTGIMASSIEPGLPDLPLTTWLQNELVQAGEIETSPDWVVDFCHVEEAIVFAIGDWRPASASARRQPRSICLAYATGVNEASVVALRLRVATVNEHTAEWTFETPSLQDLVIGGDGNVMDVPFPSLLPQVLTQPPSSFPILDVAVSPSDLRYEPADAKPGDRITVIARIQNIGDRDARLMNGLLAVQAEGGLTDVHEFVADIPVQVEVSFQSTMPASGVIVAQISPVPGVARVPLMPYSQLRDANTENNDALRPIGSKRLGHAAPASALSF
jgi:hypothetical protein